MVACRRTRLNLFCYCYTRKKKVIPVKQTLAVPCSCKYICRASSKSAHSRTDHNKTYDGHVSCLEDVNLYVLDNWFIGLLYSSVFTKKTGLFSDEWQWANLDVKEPLVFFVFKTDATHTMCVVYDVQMCSWFTVVLPLWKKDDCIRMGTLWPNIPDCWKGDYLQLFNIKLSLVSLALQ